MGVIKETAKALAVTAVLIVVGWLAVFGLPARAEKATEIQRVTAGIAAYRTTMVDTMHAAAEESRAEESKAAAERARYRKAPDGVPQKVWDYCREFATDHVSAYVLAGVAKVESDFNAKCITGKCYGLMQIHSVWEFDRFRRSESWDDPRASVRVCAEILNEHWAKYRSVRKALQVYNMGWAGAKYDSTSYSDKVLTWANVYKGRHK